MHIVERNRLNIAISALSEGTVAEAPWSSTEGFCHFRWWYHQCRNVERKGRKPMSPAERKTACLRLKNIWAAKRKAAS